MASETISDYQESQKPQVARAHSKFWGVAGSEDFASATLPTTPLDFQNKIRNFCHPTLLKIRFKITVTPPSQKMGKVKITVLRPCEWTFKPQVVVTH